MSEVIQHHSKVTVWGKRADFDPALCPMDQLRQKMILVEGERSIFQDLKKRFSRNTFKSTLKFVSCAHT